MRDYEELVKALRQCGTGDFPNCAACGVDNVTCGEIKRLRIRRAADAIEELQTQINGWIEQERKSLLKSVKPNDTCDDWKPVYKTNGDVIRQMSDEELVNLLLKFDVYVCSHISVSECSLHDCNCESCVLDWLNQEVESDGDEH